MPANSFVLDYLYGLEDLPLLINSSGGFYQHPLGSNFGWEILPAFDFFPALEFDSWVTIGTAAQAPGFTFNDVDDSFDAFASGEALYLNPSLPQASFWMTPIDETNYGQGNEENQILIAQLTVDSSAIIHGIINANAEFQSTWGLDQTDFQGMEFNSFNSDFSYIGCTDTLATNYNGALFQIDETCFYPCALELLLEDTTPTCPEESNGVINVSAIGAQYSSSFHLYSGSDLITSNSSGQFTALPSAEYTILVNDAAGCESQIDVDLQEFNQDLITLETNVLAEISCPNADDAAIYAIGMGGSGLFEKFTLSNTAWNGGFFAIQDEFFEGDTCIFYNQGPGNYSVFATDDNGCTSPTHEIEISSPVTPEWNIQSTAPSCTNGDDGSVEISVFVEDSAYLEGVHFNFSNSTFTQNPLDINLLPGIYQIELIDSVGCSYPMEFALDNPADSVDCLGICLSDLNLNGICDSYELFTASSAVSSASCGPNTMWDSELQKCVPNLSCPTDLDNDSTTGASDFLYS